MGRTSLRSAPSRTSSAAAPAASATSATGNKSAVLRAAFSLSEYQLALFASVIQGLDAQHLRVHDVSSGRLQCDYAAYPRETITSLDWGYYGYDRDEHLRKKRKRNSAVNGETGDETAAVVAFGTSSSEIRMYSPAQGKVVGTLSGVHERGISDFKFTAPDGFDGWSIGGDGKLVQWDLQAGRGIRVVSLPSLSVSVLAKPVSSDPPVLCASQTPYIISLDKEEENVVSFSAMKNTIHSLVSSSPSSLNEQFLAADSDRYINVFAADKNKLLGSLITDKEVDSVSLYSPTKTGDKTNSAYLEKQLLAVVTRDGTIELFTRPFASPEKPASTSLKAQRKQMTRRSDAKIRIVRPGKAQSRVPIVSVSFEDSDLLIARAESGSGIVFDRIQWKDPSSGVIVIHGEHTIVREKPVAHAGSSVLNDVRDLGRTQVDERHAVVKQGGTIEDMQDAGDENEVAASEADDADDAMSDVETEGKSAKHTEGKPEGKADVKADEDKEMTGTEVDEPDAEPSFGDLVNANNAVVDVESEIPNLDAAISTNTGPATAQHPSGITLVSVLSQALRTDDRPLLESCFAVKELAIVRATIERLDSALAAALLQRLAERLSVRPGRYGQLLVWVQWTCIAHGGALAGRPDMLKRMVALYRVMDARSATLPQLLLLKGKLDMLDAQLGLRRALRGQRTAAAVPNATAATAGAAASREDDDNVVYVEGQEDLEREQNRANRLATRRAARAADRAQWQAQRQARRTRKVNADGAEDEVEAGEEDSEESEDDEDGGLPLAVNGMESGSENEESDSEGEEDEGLIDDEAEESEDDDDDDDEEEESDEEEGSMDSFIDDAEDLSNEEKEPEAVEAHPKKSNKDKSRK